jgi:D-alanyl-D-alanine carboxypeptidase
MKNDFFRKIVSTRHYECYAKQKIPNPESIPDPDEHYYSIDSDEEFQNLDSTSFVPRKFRWENTNPMLSKPGYKGCKTGITDAAGFCCSITYEKLGHHLVICLFNCESMLQRWEEVPQLVEWATQS